MKKIYKTIKKNPPCAVDDDVVALLQRVPGHQPEEGLVPVLVLADRLGEVAGQETTADDAVLRHGQVVGHRPDGGFIKIRKIL